MYDGSWVISLDGRYTLGKTRVKVEDDEMVKETIWLSQGHSD
jgi:hypothetical protein